MTGMVQVTVFGAVFAAGFESVAGAVLRRRRVRAFLQIMVRTVVVIHKRFLSGQMSALFLVCQVCGRIMRRRKEKERDFSF